MDDRIHFIRWRDACYHPDYKRIEDVGELLEVCNTGFLLKETDEALTISCERRGEDEEARLYATIPKVNIVEWRSFLMPKKARKHRLSR